MLSKPLWPPGPSPSVTICAICAIGPVLGPNTPGSGLPGDCLLARALPVSVPSREGVQRPRPQHPQPKWPGPCAGPEAEAGPSPALPARQLGSAPALTSGDDLGMDSPPTLASTPLLPMSQ